MNNKRVLYYLDGEERNPVLREIRKLVPQERRKVAAYVTLLQQEGEQLRRPAADYIGDKLYELRPGAHRVLYFFFLKNNAVLLHLFRKRSDRLPDWEKRVALSRMADLMRRSKQGKICLGEAP